MPSLSLHECGNCGREHYTKTSARLCDCPEPERRAFDLDGDLCNNPITPDHFLADLVNPDSKRAEDKARLVMRTFVTSGQRTISNLVRDVFNYGADEHLTGSEASTKANSDYMLAYRLYTQNPDYFRTADQNSGTAVEPAPKLVDLITEGVSQNPDEPLGDRHFARDLLGNVDELAEEHKRHLETAFNSYLDRIDNYRIYLEARDGFAKPAGRDYLRCNYKTRFNDVGRVKRQFAKFKRALEVAPLLCHDLDDVLEAFVGLDGDDLDLDSDDIENADDLLDFSDDLDDLDSDDLDDVLARLPDRAPKGAAMVTITTNPANFESLKESIEEMNPDHNRLQSWLATQPSTKADGRHRWSGRLPYIKAFEFTKDGKPHLHLLFFGVPRRETDGKPWLVDKSALVGYCRHNLGRCRIVDLEPLEYRSDLGDEYEPDSGFISPYDNDTASRDEIQEGQTAGQYLGKYLSATFGGILDLHDRGSEYLDELDSDDLDLDDRADDSPLAEFADEYLDDGSQAYQDKTETHRLALYWATGTSILSFSKDLEDLALIDDGEDWRVAFRYVGTYHIDDTPTDLLANSVPLDFLELKDKGQLPDLSRGDRPPPRLGEGFTTEERLTGATSKSDSR